VVLRVTDPAALAPATSVLEAELAAIDLACSRFRDDSQLQRVNASAGAGFVAVSPLLLDALSVALRAAALTDGDVDPTIGSAMRLAGYTCDWELLPKAVDPGLPGPAAHRGGAAPTPLKVKATRISGWRAIELRTDPPAVRIPAGIQLDLGATAKALAADRGAAAIAAQTGAGVLVSLGGDIAVAGPAPSGGWPIHVTDDHRSAPDAPGQTITITAGALATSSTSVRRWRHAGRTMHHILDPSSGTPVDGPWRTVSVAAASCVDANIASTAAIIRGDAASSWLESQQLPARLVAHDGAVQLVGNWPAAAPIDHRAERAA
jgi:thiamine biosynthesis lipoprotein